MMLAVMDIQADSTPRPQPVRSGPPVVELVSIGRELLRGKIADTNAQRVSRALTQRGAVVRRIVVVDDTSAAISAAVRDALDRDPRLVVTTGGLGPAEDDRTIEGLCKALSLPATRDHATREGVEAAYRRLREQRVVAGSGMTAAREKLCSIPLGGTSVANPLGVAPGVWVRLAGGTIVLSLPGMPEEMLAVLEAALPQMKIGIEGHVAYREVEAPTADEAALAPLIDRLKGEFPDVWIQTRPAGSRKTGRRVVIRFEATGPSSEAAEGVVDECVKRVLDLAGGSL
jgi:molybdenum cofactor synthesis domain-containing protein